MIGNASDESDLIGQLAESFIERFRAGERPNVEEYVHRFPELAEQIKDLLPALALLEQRGANEVADICDQSTNANPLSTLSELGEFTIVREIGRGGMGIVYEAVQQSLGRHVALKVLSLPALSNVKHLERFRFEALAAARLQHRHIVQVFGVGESNGSHYYVMQFIEGQSLHQVMQDLRRTPSSASPKTTAQRRQASRHVARQRPRILSRRCRNCTSSG